MRTFIFFSKLVASLFCCFCESSVSLFSFFFLWLLPFLAFYLLLLLVEFMSLFTWLESLFFLCWVDNGSSLCPLSCFVAFCIRLPLIVSVLAEWLSLLWLWDTIRFSIFISNSWFFCCKENFSAMVILLSFLSACNRLFREQIVSAIFPTDFVILIMVELSTSSMMGVVCFSLLSIRPFVVTSQAI